MRTAEVKRKTTETDITVKVTLDGEGKNEIKTGIGFFDHMLVLFSRQGMFDLTVNAKGDLEIDDHHTIEDVGFMLGRAFDNALMERKGINRYGFFVLPMDDALAQVAIDLGGRPYLQFDAKFTREKVGEMSTELVYDFFEAFTRGSRANVSIKLLCGRNDHHKIEVIFKCFARAMRMACQIDPGQKNIPSAKEVI